MAVSMRDLDTTFQGAGQKAGIEIWRIENFLPVPVTKSSYGKFFTGDSYIILKTAASKNGVLRHDIHYWLGKDTSQDEAGSAALKAIELDAALGGRAVQYRELQGHETEKFLSYFKPCIIPQEGGVASGFKHVEAEKYIARLFVCKGKYVVHVKEVLFARSSLNHDDIFILDTDSKIFQFNGSNSSIQERAKALEVVQFLKDTYHSGKCEIASVEDGRMMADPESGEFWGFFGGFAPLPRKIVNDDDRIDDASAPKLFCVEKGQAEPVQSDSLTRDLLDTEKCYLLDCSIEVFLWMGRSSSLDDRKNASEVAEELVRSLERQRCHIVRVIEGFETPVFRLKFDSWPQINDVVVSKDGRGKVAELLKRQGVNVKGLLKAAPAKEEPKPYIDCTGNLQVWHVNGNDKTLLSASDQSKFYRGDCYIFQYTYPGEDKEEYLIGTWFGKHSVEDERDSSISLASMMIDSLKCLPTQAHIYEENEPPLFFSIFQNFIVYKGGISNAYKSYISEKEIPDETYKSDGVALFRVQGSGPDNMQAIQVEPVASSLNSCYCYILHSDSLVLTWSGSLTMSDDHEVVERLLDLIKPDVQSKPQKEGVESEQFWDLLGGKSEYHSEKIQRVAETDPSLFSCTFFKGNIKVTEIFNFTQDDLMTEDIFILDCHSEIFVWVGQQVESDSKKHALTIAKNFVERDFLLEGLSREVPIYIVKEGSEPPFFTRFFAWDSAKSSMHGNSFERKLRIVKFGSPSSSEKPKRRMQASYGGRSSVPDASQRSRSMSFSPDRIRVRGRSPAFNALAANFENQNPRNLSTPPPLGIKPFPKSVMPRSNDMSLLTSTFEKSKTAPPRENMLPPSIKGSPKSPKPIRGASSVDNLMSGRIGGVSIKEDMKGGEVENEERLPIYPYERLQVFSTNPLIDEIDVTKREAYLSCEEFGKIFGMTRGVFLKLPKWKQNKLKMSHHLF